MSSTDFLQMQNPIAICSQVLMYALLFTFILGIFRCKLIAVQMILEAQLVFFAISTLQYFTPSFNGLVSMKFIGGFYLSNQNTINILPISYQLLGLSQSFLNNFNLMLISIFLPLLVAGILMIISKFVKHILLNNKLQRIAIECICEATLYFSLFNIIKVLISFLLNIQFYDNNAGSLIFGIFVLLIILVNIILFVIFRHHYKQFKQQYHEDKRFKVHIYVLVGKTVLCAIFISINHLIGVSIYIVLAIQLIFVGYTTIFKSYLALLHYIRQIINSSISLIALILICYSSQSTKDINNIPQNVNYMPIGILILLYALLIINLGLTLRHILLLYTDWFTKSKDYQIQQQTVQKKALKKHPILPLSMPQYPLLQSPKIMQHLDINKQQQLKMMETIKQFEQYKSAHEKKITLQSMVIKQNSVKQIDDMKKILQELNANFD